MKFPSKRSQSVFMFFKFLFGMIFLCLLVSSTNAQEGSIGVATISLDIISARSVVRKDFDSKFNLHRFDIQRPPLKASIRSEKGFSEVPYISREGMISPDNIDKYYIDHYRLSVPPGIYVFEILERSSYKFANFQVRRNDDLLFTVSDDELNAEFCANGERFKDSLINGRSAGEIQPGAVRLKTERIAFTGPFNLVMSYCSKQLQGSSVRYQNAELRYKGIVVLANEFIVNKETKTVKISGVRNLNSAIDRGNTDLVNWFDLNLEIKP